MPKQRPNTQETEEKKEAEKLHVTPLTQARRAWAQAYLETGEVAAASRKAGVSLATGYRTLARPEVVAFIEAGVGAPDPESSAITTADVIARAAEILDIALCRRPWRTDADGTKVYLKAPNLAIAERMIGRLGDATGAWARRDEGAQHGGISVGTLIMGGERVNSLADVLISRVNGQQVAIDQTPQVESDG